MVLKLIFHPQCSPSAQNEPSRRSKSGMGSLKSFGLLAAIELREPAGHAGHVPKACQFASTRDADGSWKRNNPPGKLVALNLVKAN
jgi:hypothetical protein